MVEWSRVGWSQLESSREKSSYMNFTWLVVLMWVLMWLAVLIHIVVWLAEASLNELHTSRTALCTCVCMLAWTNHLISHSNVYVSISSAPRTGYCQTVTLMWKRSGARNVECTQGNLCYGWVWQLHDKTRDSRVCFRRELDTNKKIENS